MKRLSRPHYDRHRDDEIIDEITFRIVPRYKESHLSGDEWRISTVVELKRKGETLATNTYHSVKDAAAHLPWLLRTWVETLSEEGSKRWSQRIQADENTCHQVGCGEPATVHYKLKKQYSREGYEKDLTGHYCEVRRAFCDRHKRRGDCGLEDADSNYEKVQ